MSGRRRTRTQRQPKPGRGRGRQPRTLRTRLVVSAVALIAVVASVIGTVTTFALSEHLYEQLADNVQEIAKRTDGPKGPGGGQAGAPGSTRTITLTTDEKLGFVTKGGSPEYTIGAIVENGTIVKGVVGELATSGTTGQPDMTAVTLSAADLAALAKVSQDGNAHRVSLPDQGDYLVRYETNRDGDKFYVGLPTDSVTKTLSTLIVVELSVTGAGLVAAGIAGSVLVGVALRPLRRVASTATRVSELPLHTGEVTLNERVPASETDTHTEVGQVGAALNRMLDHIHGALHSRQESETRVRQFVADASHELRTPLASIRGYAELTRRGREEIGPDTRHALGRIESESSRMTMLVEDLLLLARLDAGRPLQFERTDLIPLVVDTVSDARVAGRSHNWRLDLPDIPALVSADAARLQQVLVNLLANARTHTPPGTTVTARVQRRGPWMCVDVEDNGQGIPEDLLPHVFERFARGDSSRSRASGSTGLGLAIVQAVADAHGGAVTVDSVPGRTVFTVHLPALGRDVPPLDDAANWQLDEGQYDGEHDGEFDGNDMVTGATNRQPDSQAQHSVSTRA
ncbi:sensor histidine kinase [Streptomyces europaeiscabiei]|uniref:sensor histidine kinase n=1 Tax=Streptomyces europaeiscabiei TaxID=146819 RepID=UPI0029B3F98B|nr:HAMP domain-containing sensor histidine kinase [Streptomyces europaeiscabiei]MDX3784133.1 HAMP domain-containing sensor histidine kinase [Streptomyces europaeiscabiei]MDX3841776.1 HAMP domain-containing sensor histidine kinase [Streptomyces europaeiscabiei]